MVVKIKTRRANIRIEDSAMGTSLVISAEMTVRDMTEAMTQFAKVIPGPTWESIIKKIEEGS